MKCVVCKVGNVLAGGKTTITLEREQATIIIKDVPARTCDVR